MATGELRTCKLQIRIEESTRGWVCPDHAITVVHERAHTAICQATSLQKAKKRDFIRNMLMVSGAHPSQKEEQKSDGPEGRRLRKRSAEHQPPEEADSLSSLFVAARPYIQEVSFTYSFLVTLLRAVLILNSVFEYGRYIWHGTFEGGDVCRFFCVLGTIYPRRVLSVLRGAAQSAFVVPTGEKFPLGDIGLPCVPSARTVQSFMAIPRPITHIMTITTESAKMALGIFNAMDSHSAFYAVSFDVVHGSSDLDVIVDEYQNPVLVGTAINDDLSGMLTYAYSNSITDVTDGTLPLDTLATGLMTVVLHSFTNKVPVLLATIPVNCETSSLIANATLELRRVLFLLGAYLIYGSGDGLAANLAGFRMVKDQSSGTPETKIGDVAHPCQLYFGTAGDPKEHDTKALFNQNKGSSILVNDREVRLDHALEDWRGSKPNPVLGDGAIVLVQPGDISHSSHGGIPLIEVFEGNREAATTWHRDLCKIVNMEVICAKDPMATAPAVRAAKLPPLARRIGATDEAAILDNLALIYGFSRGKNPIGADLTPEQNLTQVKALVANLTAMRSKCLEKDQTLRGGVRLRGFYTEQLYSLIVMSMVAFSDILVFLETNGVKDKRNNLPGSSSNETYHAFMRLFSKNLLIGPTLTSVGKLVAVGSLLNDQARTWPCTAVSGVGNSYGGRVDRPLREREAAISQFRATGRRAFELKAQKAVAGQSLTDLVAKGAARSKLLAVKQATALNNAKVTLSFRDRMVRGVRKASFGAAGNGRSLLARGICNHSLFLREKSKGRARATDARMVVLITSGSAAIVRCNMDTLAIISPEPAKGQLRVRIIDHKKETSYVMGLNAVVAATMGFMEGARIADANGVVAITLVFVANGAWELLSFVCKKNDLGTCRMLVNLPLLKNAFLKSALAPEGQPTPEANLLLALSAHMTASKDESTPPENAALNVIGDGSPWSALTLDDALLYVPGLPRLSSIHNGKEVPGISALTASLGSDNDADPFRRLKQSAKSKKTSNMPRGTGTADEVRMVNCYIEEKDEEEVRKKRKSTWLHDKWGGLFVVLAADGDEPEVTGTIYGFEWNEQAKCQVCTVEDSTDILTPVGVQEVPTMVENARQAEEVLLVFEEDEDVYEPDDSDIQRVDATSDSEEVDMEHGESDINDISNVRSQIASTTAMPAQSQSDSRVLRRSTRKST